MNDISLFDDSSLHDDCSLFEVDGDASNAANLTQRSLIDTRERLGSMLDVMPIGLLIHTQQAILFANQAMGDLLQSGPEELLGHHILDYVRGSEFEGVSEQLSESFGGKVKAIERECVLERSGDSERLVKIISGKLPWPGTPVLQILVQDITDQKRAELSLRQMSITDELTGAYNRRQAFYEANLYLDESGKARIPLSVIMLDADHFKKINDTYGHAVGDLALKELTRTAHEFVPTIPGTDSAIFARIGGEEFMVLLPGITASAARAVAESLRHKFEHISIALDSQVLKFTVSMGVAQFSERDRRFDDLLARADRALYDAKMTGRNRVVFDDGPPVGRALEDVREGAQSPA